MPRPMFRSLRVQVLLWTILPLLFVLVAFSLSGVGSHQVSVRQLVVEENTNLLEVASEAIEARLELYASGAGDQGGSLEAGPPALGLADLFAADGERAGQPAPTIAVMDAQKRVLDTNASPAPATLAPPQSELDALIDAALAGRRGVEFITQAGRQIVVAYAPLEGTPWAIVILRPIADLIAPFFRFEQVLPLILMAAALVSALTLHFGLSLVVRPVQALIDCALRIGQGDFSAAAQGVGGVQEIEELRQALHTMAQLLQSEHTALQDYLRDITNTQEEERARLARDLHDETVQTLIALDHKAQLVQRMFDKQPERARDHVAELRKLTTQATREVRRLSYGLRPLGLEEIGLDSALGELAHDGRTLYRSQGQPRRLAPEKELALYRIAQESLSNIRRHADASCVRMMLAYGPATVTLGIGDDGVGFELPAKLSDFTSSGHFGLMGIIERTQLIGGRLLCDSQRGRGTTIIVQAPCEGYNIAADEGIIAAMRAWLQS